MKRSTLILVGVGAVAFWLWQRHKTQNAASNQAADPQALRFQQAHLGLVKKASQRTGGLAY